MKTAKHITLGLVAAFCLSAACWAASLNGAMTISRALAALTPDGWLCLQLQGEGPLDPARIRILLDVNGRSRGEPKSGADYMLEAGRFYL